jgi:predicted outer membrane protein
MRRISVAVAAFLTVFGTAAAGQQTTGQNAGGFAQQAAVANQTDFQLGQLARIHGKSARVRQFGQAMIDDHRSALDHLSGTGGVTWPVEIDAKHRQLEQELSTLEGRAFDKRFIDAMIEDHEAMASLLRQQAGTAPTSGDTDHTASTSPERGATAGVGTSGSAKSTGERMGAVGTSGAAGASSSWAAKELRTVERHLTEAKRIQKALR